MHRSQATGTISDSPRSFDSQQRVASPSDIEKALFFSAKAVRLLSRAPCTISLNRLHLNLNRTGAQEEASIMFQPFHAAAMRTPALSALRLNEAQQHGPSSIASCRNHIFLFLEILHYVPTCHSVIELAILDFSFGTKLRISSPNLRLSYGLGSAPSRECSIARALKTPLRK